MTKPRKSNGKINQNMNNASKVKGRNRFPSKNVDPVTIILAVVLLMMAVIALTTNKDTANSAALTSNRDQESLIEVADTINTSEVVTVVDSSTETIISSTSPHSNPLIAISQQARKETPGHTHVHSYSGTNGPVFRQTIERLLNLELKEIGNMIAEQHYWQPTPLNKSRSITTKGFKCPRGKLCIPVSLSVTPNTYILGACYQTTEPPTDWVSFTNTYCS